MITKPSWQIIHINFYESVYHWPRQTDKPTDGQTKYRVASLQKSEMKKSIADRNCSATKIGSVDFYYK